MPRWVGLLGSWALLVLGLSIGGIALAAEWINLRESRQIRNARIIDEAVRAKIDESLAAIRGDIAQKQQSAQKIQAAVQTRDAQISEMRDTNQVIVVSTEENKVYVRRDGKVIFETICSTGKGTTLVENGRRMTFNTPTGKFRIISKEKDPVWVPPDWHFVEEARKTGARVVRLQPGMAIDAYSGRPVSTRRSSGIWSWGGGGSSGAVMKVKGNSVVIEENGRTRRLPEGEVIRAGNTIVIPPIGTPQRKYPGVLGTHRLNLGDGYALHGTQQVSQLGRSVSHGCVRLKNEDIAHLYDIANVGDEVIIY